jgi:hypothetical protein
MVHGMDSANLTGKLKFEVQNEMGYGAVAALPLERSVWTFHSIIRFQPSSSCLIRTL